MEHDGVVTRVTGENVTVSVEVPASCEGCRARGACGLAGDGTREVVVRHPGGRVAEGDRVTVRADAPRPVFLAYVLPCAVAVAAVAFLSPRAGEVVTAVVALVAVAGYFFLLFLCRDILARAIKFTIVTRGE
ncbi:MAG: SoxR reducing system RseC family protein [Odoribacteraceae bacterium]|jgi:sigma-E factor negative regulatory protein RseC|nr:SoxR reducing system RseC family protein [Odoribacteraceae bacterium]